jgi:hypothetical protein
MLPSWFISTGEKKPMAFGHVPAGPSPPGAAIGVSLPPAYWIRTFRVMKLTCQAAASCRQSRFKGDLTARHTLKAVPGAWSDKGTG